MTITDTGGYVSVIFPVISGGGNTIITAEMCQPGQVNGISLTTAPICADIQTDAAFAGMIEVCIIYDDTGLILQHEQSLRMVSCDAQGNCELLPESRAVDIVSNVVCAMTSYFSIFAVGIPLDRDNDNLFDLLDNCKLVKNPDQADDNSGDDDNTSTAGIQHYGDLCDPDFDDDGLVTLTDYATWRKYYRQDTSTAPPFVDLDGDNLIGLSDYAIWRKYYRGTPGP